MSKIRLGTTNINFKSKMDLNRVFTSVVSVAPVGPAGALMARIINVEPLARNSISNIVMNGTNAYFTSCGNGSLPFYGFLTKVDLTTNSPTALTKQFSDPGVSWWGSEVNKASTAVTSNASVVNTTGSGSINTRTLTVASSAGILAYSIVSGTGINTNTQVLGVNGNVLTLSQNLLSTITSSAVTFTDLPTGIHWLTPYNDTNSAMPFYGYNIFNFSTLATSAQTGIPTIAPVNFGYVTSSVVRNTDGSFWGIGDDQYANGNGYQRYFLTKAGQGNGSGTGWVKYLDNVYSSVNIKALTRDSTNNAIILLSTTDNVDDRTTLAKIQSGTSGPSATLWRNDFTLNGGFVNFKKGNLFTFNDFNYIVGKNSDGSHLLIKLDTNGNVVWAKKLSGMVNTDGDVSIHVETVSTVTNVYLAGNADGGISVVCYTDAGSSATLSWQNIFKPATGSIPPINNLAKDSSVYITGNGTSFIYILSRYIFATAADPFILKLPTSGAYTSSTFTINSKNFTYDRSTYTNTDVTSVTSSTSGLSWSYATGGIQSISGGLGTVTSPTTTTSNTTF